MSHLPEMISLIIWEIPLLTKLFSPQFQEDCNAILVNWEKGARGPQYSTAAANTELVGRQLRLLLENILALGQKPEKIHLIGFSLGAHVAACASQELKDKDILLGRITG